MFIYLFHFHSAVNGIFHFIFFYFVSSFIFSLCCLPTFFPRYQIFCSVSPFFPFSLFLIFWHYLLPSLHPFFYPAFELQCSFLFVCWQLCLFCKSVPIKLPSFTPLAFLRHMHPLFLQYFSYCLHLILFNDCIVICLNFLPFLLFHLSTCFDCFVFNLYLPFVS